jgi:uncharacterized OsmC-like protein
MHMRDQEERHFAVSLTHLERFQFSSQAHEGGVPHGAPYRSDEPDPVGDASGPSTPALLASAVGHCLSASLYEMFRHAGLKVLSFETEAFSVVALNAEGFPRIKRIEVCLKPELAKASPNIERCIEVFERYCTVCQSVRPAFPVDVRVEYRVSIEAPTQAAA